MSGEALALAGLRSVTLARLYLQQGHHEAARAMLEAILEETPDDGKALALRDRLRVCERPTLRVIVEPRAATIAWQRAPSERGDLHAVAVTFGRAHPQTVRVTSRRVAARDGQVMVDCGEDPGSIVALLIAAGEGSPRTLAVAEPLSLCP
ncbi:MAG: tetratricopeptide repeat protein [Nannocystaceae bacterium]|nr:tetratricopeptide repeat protein [Myxococcales bacterium]